MAQAIVITLEKDLTTPEGAAARAAYAKGKTGKALARELERLDGPAKFRGAAAPTSLVSENQSILAEKMRAEGFDPSKMRLPPELFFDAAEGLKTVRALAEWIPEHMRDFKQPNPILRDLKAAETLLAAAAGEGVRFHLTKVEM